MKLTNYEDAEWRTNRLKVVRTYVEYMGYDKSINCLHDHKGCLEVYWNKMPSKDESASIHQMWLMLNEEMTSHFIGKDPHSSEVQNITQLNKK